MRGLAVPPHPRIYRVPPRESGTNGSIWWGNYGSFFEPISQRGRRGFPLGLELKNLQRIWISAKKRHFLLRLVQDPARSKWPAFTSFYGRSNSDSLRKHPFLLALLSAIKPKETVKLQTDTKTQRNILLVSLFYSFHSRKSKVQRYSAFADLSNIFLILSLLYFQRSPVTRHRRVTYSM